MGKDGFTFKALVSVRPEVKLGEYLGLTAPKEEVKVTDKDIDEELKPYIDRATRLVSVKRKAKKVRDPGRLPQGPGGEAPGAQGGPGQERL